MRNDELRETATRKVEAKLGFYVHLVVFVAVNALLVVLNLVYSSEHLWFYWPLFGWGIGIFFHAMAVFVFPAGSAIKERMIERETKKLTSNDEP